MSETISTTEVENALSAIFQKIDTVEGSIVTATAQSVDAQETANHALSVAKAAKDAVKNIKTVPTNGSDVFIAVFKKVSGLVALGIVTWGVVKVLTYDPYKKEKSSKE